VRDGLIPTTYGRFKFAPAIIDDDLEVEHVVARALNLHTQGWRDPGHRRFLVFGTVRRRNHSWIADR
jgi:hypothetical protein